LVGGGLVTAATRRENQAGDRQQEGATMKELFASMLAAVAVLSACPAVAAKDDAAKARAEIRKTTKEILGQLYKVQPSAKKAVAGAAGYAVFSNFGMKIFVAGSGKGMAVNARTKKEVFMKMIEVQAGFGLGVKQFRVVFVFDSEKGWNDFVNSGWEAGTQATAAAKGGASGAAYDGAVSVSPGIWLYQLTDTGLAIEATVKGTKYYKDDALN
jgi:lipid-binding SYLF domain-containing protein